MWGKILEWLTTLLGGVGWSFWGLMGRFGRRSKGVITDDADDILIGRFQPLGRVEIVLAKQSTTYYV